MATAKARSGPDTSRGEVLTLAEAAAYLRVPEEELAALAGRHGVPARQVGEQWRFSKEALAEWLCRPHEWNGEAGGTSPHRPTESALTEELLRLLEERLLAKLKQTAAALPQPGSKEAVLRGFGVFQDDDDLEYWLADARARRKAGG